MGADRPPGGGRGGDRSPAARTFEAWCVPLWSSGAPDVAMQVLPPARARTGEPPDTALTLPELRVTHLEALARALRAQAAALRDRPVADVVRTLGRVGERFLSPGDPLRREALDVLPGTSGLSPAMCLQVLDGMARDWTAGRLEGLLRADFADPACLDRFVPAPGVGGAGDEGHRRELRALGPGLTFHLTAGSVPGVSATSLIRSLLVKAPVLLKPGRGDVALPVLLLRAIAQEDPGLARGAAVVYWSGRDGASAALEAAALERADVVVVYGGDAAVRSVRARLPATARLVAYHHRIGLGVAGRDVSPGPGVEALAAEAARAVALFDQRGCVSPRVLFVEDGPGHDAFVDALAAALDRLDRELPRGRIDDAEASAVQQLRGTVEMRAAAGEDVALRTGSGWTVVVEREGPLVPSCAGRVLRVVPVDDVSEIPGRVEHLGAHLQTVAVGGVEGPRLEALAEALARVGALRVVPFAQAAFPPAWWRHDGRGPLEVLIRWAELTRATARGEGGDGEP